MQSSESVLKRAVGREGKLRACKTSFRAVPEKRLCSPDENESQPRLTHPQRPAGA